MSLENMRRGKTMQNAPTVQLQMAESGQHDHQVEIKKGKGVLGFVRKWADKL